MKKLLTTAAIAITLLTTSAFAETDSNKLNCDGIIEVHEAVENASDRKVTKMLKNFTKEIGETTVVKEDATQEELKLFAMGIFVSAYHPEHTETVRTAMMGYLIRLGELDMNDPFVAALVPVMMMPLLHSAMADDLAKCEATN
jgi:hypothetical protein